MGHFVEHADKIGVEGSAPQTPRGRGIRQIQFTINRITAGLAFTVGTLLVVMVASTDNAIHTVMLVIGMHGNGSMGMIKRPPVRSRRFDNVDTLAQRMFVNQVFFSLIPDQALVIICDLVAAASKGSTVWSSELATMKTGISNVSMVPSR